MKYKNKQFYSLPGIKRGIKRETRNSFILFHNNESDSFSSESQNSSFEYYQNSIFMDSNLKTPLFNQQSMSVGPLGQLQNQKKQFFNQDNSLKQIDQNFEQETRNLASQFTRLICRNCINKFPTNSKAYKKIKKFKKTTNSSTISSLQSLLLDDQIRNQALNYFSSYQFLEDILSSNKLKDIGPPIKYLNKMYQVTINPYNFKNWK